MEVPYGGSSNWSSCPMNIGRRQSALNVAIASPTQRWLKWSGTLPVVTHWLVKEGCTAIPLALAVPEELSSDLASERPEVEHTGYFENVSSD